MLLIYTVYPIALQILKRKRGRIDVMLINMEGELQKETIDLESAIRYEKWRFKEKWEW